MPTIIALAVVLVANLGPAQQPEYVPAGNEAYTADLELDGYINGKMDSDRMMTVRDCTLERDAAYLYSLMVDAAEKDGVYLGHKDCYRTYAAQKAGYDRRCPYVETPVYSFDTSTGEWAQTGTSRARECSGPPVAPAGASNHGWGRAVDFANRHGVLTCYDRAFDWLRNNAYRFGWIHPVWARCGKKTQEPWHWEFAGVTDPTLVPYVKIDPTLIPEIE